MKIFTLSKKHNIVCNRKNTRNGFKHTATICENGREVYDTKICYCNRSWESFEYESVLHKAIENYFDKKFHKRYIDKLNKQDNSSDVLKTASMVASFGNILCNTDKDKNKFKKRMLNAVNGIDFPDDFDTLSEEEKKKRLDKAISVGLKKK